MRDTGEHGTNPGYSALHHQKDTFDNPAQEHQRVACEEV